MGADISATSLLGIANQACGRLLTGSAEAEPALGDASRLETTLRDRVETGRSAASNLHMELWHKAWVWPWDRETPIGRGALKAEHERVTREWLHEAVVAHTLEFGRARYAHVRRAGPLDVARLEQTWRRDIAAALRRPDSGARIEGLSAISKEIRAFDRAASVGFSDAQLERLPACLKQTYLETRELRSAGAAMDRAQEEVALATFGELADLVLTIKERRGSKPTEPERELLRQGLEAYEALNSTEWRPEQVDRLLVAVEARKPRIGAIRHPAVPAEMDMFSEPLGRQTRARVWSHMLRSAARSLLEREI